MRKFFGGSGLYSPQERHNRAGSLVARGSFQREATRDGVARMPGGPRGWERGRREAEIAGTASDLCLLRRRNAALPSLEIGLVLRMTLSIVRTSERDEGPVQAGDRIQVGQQMRRSFREASQTFAAQDPCPAGRLLAVGTSHGKSRTVRMKRHFHSRLSRLLTPIREVRWGERRSLGTCRVCSCGHRKSKTKSDKSFCPIPVI